MARTIVPQSEMRIENMDIPQAVEAVTGEPLPPWTLDQRLEASGLTFAQRDPIDAGAFAELLDIVRAAFRAGYLVGRNPDRILLVRGRA